MITPGPPPAGVAPSLASPIPPQPIPPMPPRKGPLPTKLCPVCQRPFTWRKKWERVWDEVKFCSDRCRMMKGKTRSD